MSVAVWKRTLYRFHISCKLWDFCNTAARKGNQFCHLFSQLNIDPNFPHFIAASLLLYSDTPSVRETSVRTVNLLPPIFFFAGAVHRRARIRHSLRFHHTLSPPLAKQQQQRFLLLRPLFDPSARGRLAGESKWRSRILAFPPRARLSRAHPGFDYFQSKKNLKYWYCPSCYT